MSASSSTQHPTGETDAGGPQSAVGLSRKQKAEERKKERAALALKFPGARLDHCRADHGVVVELEDGDDLHLVIKSRGQWEKCRDCPGEWREESIHLAFDVDLAQLAGFINALVRRYNALVDEVSAAASQVPNIPRSRARRPATRR